MNQYYLYKQAYDNTSKIKNKHESILPQFVLLELRADNVLEINY
jgi:hypothetical protein